MRARRIGLRGAGWRRAGVREVDLTVQAGDALGLVGPSGAGKTTIARMLAGLLRPSEGELLQDDGPLRWPPPRSFHRDVQYLHQAPALDPRMTLQAHMLEARQAAGLDSRWQPHWESVGLEPDLAGRRPPELSGGQRHRAALARVLAVEPRFLILDEPTQGQDPPRVREFEALLAGLGTRGLVVLSHELGLVRSRTRRLGMVYGGRLVELGPTEQVLQDPQHEATRRWVEAARRWAGEGA